MDIRLFAGSQAGPAGTMSPSVAPAVAKSSAIENRSQLANAVQGIDAPPSAEQTKQAVQQINEAIASLSQGVVFSIDEDSKRTIVKVVDSQTKEVLRQMPSKEALEIARALDRVQGMLIKQQA